MGGMGLADLVMDLRSSLRDAASTFTAPGNEDFVRHLTLAAADMHRIRPRTLIGEVLLTAGVSEYQAPADLLRFKSAIWGVQPDYNRAKPWEKTWPGLLPRCQACAGLLSMLPAPTENQIALLGRQYRFYYVAVDRIGEAAADTTIAPGDRHLLLMRAQAEAMHELAMRDSVRPVQVGGGHGQQAKTGTPQAIWDQLMKAWLLAVR